MRIRKRFSKEALRAHQNSALRALRGRFAENGYLIFHLVISSRSSRYKRLYDFVAVPKEDPEQFLIVQGGKTSALHVRPFGAPGLYGQARKILKQFRTETQACVRWKRQLSIRRKNMRLKDFLSAKSCKELLSLLPHRSDLSA